MEEFFDEVEEFIQDSTVLGMRFDVSDREGRADLAHYIHEAVRESYDEEHGIDEEMLEDVEVELYNDAVSYSIGEEIGPVDIVYGLEEVERELSQ